MQAIEEIASAPTPTEQDPAKVQIRGSSLFLFGRFLSLGINFSTQVLIVRYLSTSSYGALAYGLAVASFLRLFSTLGLHEAISRFVPIYREHREYEKLFGTILLSTGTVFLAAALLIIGTLQGSRFLTHDQLALQLLAILIFLVPVEAVDCLLDALFASFECTRGIFYRKYILGPGFTFVAVLALLLAHSSVYALAFGYLTASSLAELVYVWMFFRLMRTEDLLKHLAIRKIQVPAREVLAFVLPGICAILATAGIPSINILLLGHMRPMTDVAYYRAAVPLAELNGVVLTSFGLLYIPSAARLFARADLAGMSKLYWQTAAWMSVLSFPIFAATFALATPLAVFLYGTRYAGSGPVLALLALASYCNVMLGFNLQTLKVIEKLRYIVVASIAAVLTNVIVSALLIPKYGATGAGIGAAVSLIGFNLALQAGLLPTRKFHAFDRHCCSIYIMVGVSVAALILIIRYTSLNFFAAIALAAAVSLFILVASKKKLNLAETFPELLSVPILKFILA